MSYVKNKKAFFDYNIIDTFEAGIQLQGWEVKSIRHSMANLKDSYIKITPQGAYITGMHISRWKTQAKSEEINKIRDRKLLLKKSELQKLDSYRKNPGYTIVPLKLYPKHNVVKIEIGVGKGKKQYDKREAVKKKEIKKDINRRGNIW